MKAPHAVDTIALLNPYQREIRTVTHAGEDRVVTCDA
jgi:hypothetical protein